MKGALLVARPELVDPNFARTVISLLAHDEDGALGVVLNRPAEIGAAAGVPVDLAARSGLSVDDRVHIGGPVETDALVVVGETPDGGPSVWSDQDLGADQPAGGRVRLYLGYAGWSAGQLEAEIAGGSWIVCGPETGDHLAPDPDRLWHDVLVRQPVPTRLLAWYPGDLSAN